MRSKERRRGAEMTPKGRSRGRQGETLGVPKRASKGRSIFGTQGDAQWGAKKGAQKGVQGAFKEAPKEAPKRAPKGRGVPSALHSARRPGRPFARPVPRRYATAHPVTT